MTTDAVAAAPPPAAYPVRYSVDYPEGPRNRLTVLVRIILVIPIVVVFSMLASGGGTASWNAGNGGRDADVSAGRMQGQFRDRAFDAAPAPFRQLSEAQRRAIIGAVAGVALLALVLGPAAVAAGIGMSAASAPLVTPTALMLIFRRKYPRWWFDFTREVANFGARVGAYAALQRDEYPSTDEAQAARVEIDYPDAQQLNRWLPLVKWLLAIPHYVVLFILFIGLVFVTLIAWIAILVTGRYPRGLHEYTAGVQRWATRVSGYAFWLVTDQYPPFSMR
ncbi:MAG: DUF4389 domain-containing protein [Dehalococcoidia bacterium]